MAKWQYTKGLHELGNGLYAYLLPDGGWGWSNAGLIVDGEETVLVDTLFDLPLTRYFDAISMTPDRLYGAVQSNILQVAS